ncbi:MAG: hypothetical protein JWM52_138 [Candidatus Saccharibacteria bacterium]|nr:hypothetical protein [Candidatus Saccharibacteria bacterium]
MIVNRSCEMNVLSTKLYKRVTNLSFALVLVLSTLVSAAGPFILSQPTFAATTRTTSVANLAATVAIADPGDVIDITTSGTLSSQVVLNKELRLTSSNGSTIDVAPGIGAIGIQANNVTVDHINFKSNWQFTDTGIVTRALEVSSYNNISIKNNTFNNLRQPAYINDNTTGTIQDNYTNVTKGWVLVSNSDFSFSGNTWGDNVEDVAIIEGTGANNYPDSRIVTISDDNNDAVVENQYGPVDRLSDSFVIPVAYARSGAEGTKWNPYTSVQSALNRTVAGGTTHVANGTYTEKISLTKGDVTIIGQNRNNTIIKPLNNEYGMGFTSEGFSNVTLSRLTISTTNSATNGGSAIKFHNAENIRVNNVSVVTAPGNNMRGIDINGVDGVTLASVSVTGFTKNGIAITGKYAPVDTFTTRDVRLNGVTSSNNGWSGVAFYSVGGGGATTNINNIRFLGTNTFSNNGQVGVFFEGGTDLGFITNATPTNAFTGASNGNVDLGNTTFSGNGLDVVNYQTKNVTANGAVINGKIGANMSSAELTAAESRIIDKNDVATYGDVILDSVAPAIPTNLTPTDGTVTNDVNFQMGWTGSTDATVYEYQTSYSKVNATTLGSIIYADSSATAGNFGGVGTTSITRNNSNTPQATYYWQVRAGDASGNWSNWSAVSGVTVDTQAPTATFAFSGTGSSAKTFDVTFSESVNVVDATNPANYFLSNWPGAGGSGDLAGDATVTYNPATNTATVTLTQVGWYLSGEQKWGVQNVRDLGGTSVAETTAYTTAMTAPNTTGFPTTTSPTNSTTVNWTWTAATDEPAGGASGIKGYEYALTLAGETPSSWTFTTNLNATTTLPATDGSYQLHVRALDNAGNTGAEVVGTVELDTTGPNADIDAATFTTNTINLTGTVDADAEGVAILITDADGNPVATDTATYVPGETTWSYNVTLPNGTYSVAVQAVDALGNPGDIATANITVAVPAPTPVETIVPAVTTTAPVTVTPTTPQIVAQTAVLGATTDNTKAAQDAAVEGVTDDKTGTVATANDGSIFGLAWYWWLLIIAALAAILWFIIAALRRRSAE